MKKFKMLCGISTAVCMACTPLFAACGGNEPAAQPDGSAYLGAASQEIFASERLAVDAFLENELIYNDRYSSSVDSAEVTDVAKGRALTAAEISAMALDERPDEAYYCTFEYTVQNGKGEYAEELSSSHDIKLLKYQTGYKYYSGEPKVGEALTNSYLKYLTDPSKFDKTSMSCSFYRENDVADMTTVYIDGNIVHTVNTCDGEIITEDYDIQQDEWTYSIEVRYIDQTTDKPFVGDPSYIAIKTKHGNGYGIANVIAGLTERYLFDYCSPAGVFYVKTESGFAERKELNFSFLYSSYQFLVDAGSIEFGQQIAFSATVKNGCIANTTVTPDYFRYAQKSECAVKPYNEHIVLSEKLKEKIENPDRILDYTRHI